MLVTCMKPAGEGCAASFFRIRRDKTRGFKEFTSYHAAYVARWAQEYAAQYSLAPNVYSDVIRISRPNGKQSGWGYITEIAELICDSSVDEDEADFLECEYDGELYDLALQYDEINCGFHDAHICNVGYIVRDGEKKLVCIDFGSESFSIVRVKDSPCDCIECIKHNRFTHQ